MGGLKRHEFLGFGNGRLGMDKVIKIKGSET